MGDCTCLDCRQPSMTWVCDECQKKRDESNES